MPQWFVNFEPSTRSKNLHWFCIEQKVSYTKMLHCLRNDSYRKIKKHSFFGLNVPKVTTYAA